MAVGPPFDYVIGTDVVYAEHLLEPLLQTIIALSGPKTTILLGYEIRSTNVHERMLEMWKRNFEVKTVSKAKMDSTYQHPSIQLFIMRPLGKCSENIIQMAHQRTEEEDGASDITDGSEEDDDSNCGIDQDDFTSNESKADNSKQVLDLENSKLSEWEARRHGAVAARLLRDVKIA